MMTIPTINWALIFVLLPLIVAAVLVARLGLKELKTPTGKLKAVGKAVAYLLTAFFLACTFAKGVGTTGGVFGTILSSLLALTTILCVTQPFNRGAGWMQFVHAQLWAKHWKTPVYSRSNRAVPHIRWARRIVMLLFVLFIFIVALIGGAQKTTTQQAYGDVDIPPAATAPTQAQQPTPEPTIPEASPTSVEPTTGSTPESSPSADTSSTSSTVENPCKDSDPKIPGVNPEVVDVESTLKLKTARHLQVCHDGSWMTWKAAYGKDVTVMVTLKAWTQQGSYGYAAITMDDGSSYIIRTTDF